MNRFSMWLAGFMLGRYGMDNLNKFLLVVTLIIIVINLFVAWRLLHLLSVLLLIYIYCRMLSRNINARYAENQKFLAFANKFKGSGKGKGGFGGNFNGGFSQTKDKTHKILRCPSCGEKLRVPKGAGKISISCPYCNTKFVKKV